MNIRQALRDWSTYRATVRELADLDNRQLNDIGIHRADIDKVARRHVAGL